MRTTLDIDDDVLAAVKELAAVEGLTAGRLVSELLRQSLTSGARHDHVPLGSAQAGYAQAGFSEGQQAMFDSVKREPFQALDGWVVLGSRGGLVTNDLVRRIEAEIDQEEVDRARAVRRERAPGAE